MRLTFLGTRGEIEARTPLHQRHSALLVEHRGTHVLVDCGLDWRGELGRLAPDAVVVTHAHPDHAGGLRGGAPCPVYATDATWAAMERYGIAEARCVRPRRSFLLGGLAFEAFSLVHSVRVPTVGYRIAAGRVAFFYAPDVVLISEQRDALRACTPYVGDGASVTKSIIRRRDGVPIGHASIRTQLGWCVAEGVTRAIFTHCGSQIVQGDEGEIAQRVRELGAEHGVDAAIAQDGMTMPLGRP